MTRHLLLLLVLVSIATPAAKAQDHSRFEAFGGFSYLSADPTPSTGFGSSFSRTEFSTDQRGWIGSFAYRPFKHLEFVGDVSGHYGGHGATYQNFPENPAPGQGGLTLAVNIKEKTHLFLGGPRGRVDVGRLSVFAEALFGVAYRNDERAFSVLAYLPGCHDVGCDPGIDGFLQMGSESSFAYGGGGGLDITLSKQFAVRVIQADYIHTNLRDAGQHNGRFSTGIVFRF